MPAKVLSAYSSPAGDLPGQEGRRGAAAHAATIAHAAQQESAGALLRLTFSAVAAILLRRTQLSHPGAQLDWVSQLNI